MLFSRVSVEKSVYFSFVCMQYLLMIIICGIMARGGLALFKHLKILDKPGNDIKNTRKPIPTLQGIFVYLIFIALIAILHPDFLMLPLVQGFLAGGAVIVIIELFAELEYMGRISRKIPPRARLIMHIFAACLALWISGISNYELIVFNEVFILPNRLLYFIFAMWSIFVINAVNRIDGIHAQGNGILTI